MSEKNRKLQADVKNALTKLYLDRSIEPDKTVAILRKVAILVNDYAKTIEQTECVNESQSRTDIGADSDTPQACGCATVIVFEGEETFLHKAGCPNTPAS